MINIKELTNDDVNNIEWFKDKRNKELKRFNDHILKSSPIDVITKHFSVLMRIQNQLKLIENMVIIKNIKNNEIKE